MSEYKLANGYSLSDEEIEERAGQWEEGTWEGSLVTLRVGRPRLSPRRTATCRSNVLPPRPISSNARPRPKASRNLSSCARRRWRRLLGFSL